MTIEPEIILTSRGEQAKAARKEPRKSSESYMHRCAGDVVAIWAAAAFPDMPLRVEREYVIATNSSGYPVYWDGPSPTYDEAVRQGFKVLAVADVALVAYEGPDIGIVEAIEIVYTSWPSQFKADQLRRYGIGLRIIEAAWVMRQTEPPSDFRAVGYSKL